MARVLKDNKVLVTVYSEREATKFPVNSHYQLGVVNKATQNQWKHEVASKGYDRRAELIKYSRQLRASKRSPAPPQIQIPDPVCSKNKHPVAKKTVINLIFNICGKPKGASFTTCFSNPILRSRKPLTSSPPKKERMKQKQKQSSGSTKDNMKSRRVRRLLRFTCS